jgi:2-dehydropantoate 2-reductase
VTAREIRSIAIIGAGAMGVMYAVHLADAGDDVAFVATGDRAQRLARDGIRVNGVHRSFPVIDPHRGPTMDAAASTREATPVDLLIVAVKADQLTEAVEIVAPLVADHTTILSVLNGLDSEEALAARYGREQVILSMAAGWRRRGSTGRCVSVGWAASASASTRACPKTPRSTNSDELTRSRRSSTEPALPGSLQPTSGTRCGGSSWSTSASTWPPPSPEPLRCLQDRRPGAQPQPRAHGRGHRGRPP